MTYPQNFINWAKTVLSKAIEGGISNRSLKDDPGGLTNRGVTFSVFKRVAKKTLGIEPTVENFYKLTEPQAQAIGYADYWLANHTDKVKPIYQIIYMDSVWHGGGIKSLGYADINSLNNSNATIQQIGINRLNYLKKLKNWEANKNGWINRLTAITGISSKNLTTGNISITLLVLIVIFLILIQTHSFTL